MRSLFVRIFLGFWLTVTLAGGLMALVAYLSRPPQSQAHLDRNLQFAARGLDGYAEDALNILRAGGVDAWRAHLATLDAGSPLPMVFTGKDRTLGDAPVPAAAVEFAGRIFADRAIQALTSPEFLGFGRPLTLPDGTLGVFVVLLKKPELPGSSRPEHGPPPGFMVGQLAIFLVIGGGICFWLTRSLTAPIRKLREATRKFAAGDFTTRVGKGIGGKDELSELARDFDRMAERIADLVDSQQRLQRDISHELRSPLTRLNIALELARRRVGSESAAALDRIGREAELMNEMIGQLLDLNLLETGTRQIPREEVDLSALVSEIVADADFEARDRQRAVVFRRTDRIAVQGSRELLRRGIENVIRNGVHYTGEGSAVEVALTQDAATGRVGIRVRDHGLGVAEEELEKIFQPFYRTAVARDRQSGGSGIGLAIVERAVRRHGGRSSPPTLQTAD
ncbi:ATP-binding protein [Trichloromonas sp.]|uniref:ATP-binding protein n=1 Tax=Trichloromonas sp. TaxID=3069249 RepID=UPI002A4D3C9B|nr:HAMP domain-containing protein [Trichloromonas sp.]